MKGDAVLFVDSLDHIPELRSKHPLERSRLRADTVNIKIPLA